MPSPTRRPRPLTSTFDPDVLRWKWSGLAALRASGFSWDGSSYAGANSSKVGDDAGLALHYLALKPLVEVAPTGFPSHISLQITLEKLDQDHCVLKTEPRFAARAANIAAENWRTMCKHLYGMAIAGATPTDPKVAELVGLIKLRDAEGSKQELQEADESSVPSLASGAMCAEVALSLFPATDFDDEVLVSDADEDTATTNAKMADPPPRGL